METKICKKCHKELPNDSEHFYFMPGRTLETTCKRCRTARRRELDIIGPVLDPDPPKIVYPRADRRCPCCGFLMADIKELWGIEDKRVCRICEADTSMKIKVVHS